MPRIKPKAKQNVLSGSSGWDLKIDQSTYYACPAFCFRNHCPQVPEEIQMALKQMTGGPSSFLIREKQLNLHWEAIFHLSPGQNPQSMIMCSTARAEGHRAASPITGSWNWYNVLEGHLAMSVKIIHAFTPWPSNPPSPNLSHCLC